MEGIVIVGGGDMKDIILAEALRACDTVCAVDTQKDDAIYEITNARVEFAIEAFITPKEVPHYRDLEFKNKKKRFIKWVH